MCNSSEEFADSQHRDSFVAKRFNFKNASATSKSRNNTQYSSVLNPEPRHCKEQYFNSLTSSTASVLQDDVSQQHKESLPSNSFNAVTTKCISSTITDDDDFFDSFKNKDFSNTKRFNFNNFKHAHKSKHPQCSNKSPQSSECLKTKSFAETKVHVVEKNLTNDIEVNRSSKTFSNNPVFKFSSSDNNSQSSHFKKSAERCDIATLKKLENVTPKLNSSLSSDVSLQCKNNQSAVSPFFQHNALKSSRTEICGSPVNSEAARAYQTVCPINKSCESNVNIKGEENGTSPVIKPKKFVFKKKLALSLSSNKSTLSQIEKLPKKSKAHISPIKKESNRLHGSPSKLFPLEKKSQKQTLLDFKSEKNDVNVYKNELDFKSNKCPRTQDSADNVGKNVDPGVDHSFGNDVTLIAKSLQVTDADYMDDEEFERRFGSWPDSLCESGYTSVTDNKQEVLGDSELRNGECSNRNDTSDISDILNEISDINWEEEVFDEPPPVCAPAFDNRKDDSREFCSTYPHSEVMLEVLHQKFGLRSFRPHQREIINASLTGHDCFVLMPTGGGKSLCYQLPSILMPGVTIVISPLRALISDQVDKLNALDIAAAHLCSDVSKDDANLIMSKLHVREPTIKLLYLTPEKLNASKNVVDVLQSLYNRGKLARFVIDEAHCLSQWGHDFRPDYKQLSQLRTNYKDVPIICLTATATKQVENDVINILKLRNVKRFITSFNRPNIKYQVVAKNGMKATVEIASLIKKKFAKMSGIVYCLSRQDCDFLAEDLNNMGIKSKPYHAGMADKVREVIQREWMQDRFHVIVATIAFGMGIDKPDVRFVIHNSIPKSVEAFYQESGRAGRDGEISYSYLFYSYGDVGRLKRIMQKDKNVNKKSLNAHFENLNQMVAFAENVVDCRRHLQLLHLGERFDRQICIRNKETICDNCENANTYKSLDVTKEAKEICCIIKDISLQENVTQLHIAAVYKGSKLKKILQKGHNRHRFYGAGANLERDDIQRILKELVLKHILQDHCVYTGEFPQIYVRPGSKFNMISNPGIKITIPVSTRKEIKPSSRHTDYPELDIPVREVESPKTTTKSARSSKPSTSTAAVKKVPLTKLTLMQLKVQCHEDLLEECRRLAVEKNLTLSSIMNLSAIKSMSEVLPNSKEEFLKIQHVTNANYNKFGDFFLAITKKYREKVDAMEAALSTTPEEDDDIWANASTSTANRGKGVKRKGDTVNARSTGKRNKRACRKPKKRKTTAKKNSGWLGKKNISGGGGKLGLMPIHYK